MVRTRGATRAPVTRRHRPMVPVMIHVPDADAAPGTRPQSPVLVQSMFDERRMRVAAGFPVAKKKGESVPREESGESERRRETRYKINLRQQNRSQSPKSTRDGNEKGEIGTNQPQVRGSE